MRIFREVIGGVIFAVITTTTVVGGIGLAVIESDNSFFAPPAIAQVTLLPTETLFVPSPVLPLPTGTPGPAFSATPCTPPQGWSPVTVGPNETLLTIASRIGISAQVVSLANCLASDSVFAGQVLFLPAAISAIQQPTAIPCGPPPDWIFSYVVRGGDNLFRISLRYGVGLNDLLQANCLTSTNISVGQRLYVPPVAAIADTAPPPPTFTVAPVATVTPVPTNTTGPGGPPATNTNTATSPAPTARPTTAVAPTFTFTVTATDDVEVSPTPTETSTSETPTDTPTSETPTETPTPETPTETPVTPTETETPVPPTETETPTPEPSPG